MNHTGTFLLVWIEFVNNESGQMLSKVDNLKRCVPKATLFDVGQRYLLTRGYQNLAAGLKIRAREHTSIRTKLDLENVFTQIRCIKIIINCQWRTQKRLDDFLQM